MSKSLQNQQVWVVVPAYNESKYLSVFLRKLSSFTSNILVVDDGSTDATAELAAEFATIVLSHPINVGKGAALKTGCEYLFTNTDAAAVIFMDGDDQHHPGDLPKMIAALEKYPVVFGTRSLDASMPVMRRVGNFLISGMVWLSFGTFVPDILCGFKGISATAYDTLVWKAEAYDVELELTVNVLRSKLNFTTVSVKTIYHDFDRGMTLLDALRIVGELISWRFLP